MDVDEPHRVALDLKGTFIFTPGDQLKLKWDSSARQIVLECWKQVESGTFRGSAFRHASLGIPLTALAELLEQISRYENARSAATREQYNPFPNGQTA